MGSGARKRISFLVPVGSMLVSRVVHLVLVAKAWKGKTTGERGLSATYKSKEAIFNLHSYMYSSVLSSG